MTAPRTAESDALPQALRSSPVQGHLEIARGRSAFWDEHICPRPKGAQYLMQVARPPTALPPIILHPTVHPIVWAYFFLNFLERDVPQLRSFNIDRDRPSGIIQSADLNSELMLPISIATSYVKRLK